MSDNEKKVQPLPAKTRALYGIGDCTFTLMSSVETFFWNNFLTNIAGFAPGVAAVIMTIGSTVDACLSWCYGAILDLVKPKKWGRYRSWLILLPWIVPFLFAFQFLSVSSNLTVSAIVIVAACIISHFIWNIPWSANVTLISVMGKTPEQRMQLSSSRGTWNNFGQIIFSFFTPGQPAMLALTAFIAGLIGEASTYAALAFVLGVIMVICYWIHFVISKGMEEIEDPEAYAKRPKKEKTSFKDMLIVLGKTPSLICLIIADLPRWMVRFVVSGAAIYYFRDVAARADLMFTYVLLVGIGNFLGALLVGFLSKKLSSRTLFLGSCIFMALMFFIAFFSISSVWAVIIFVALAQFGFGASFATAAPLYADTAVYAEWKTGKDYRGWIMGLGTIPLKVSIVMKGIFMNACLAAVGYVSKAMADAGQFDASQIYNVATATAQTKRIIAMPFTLIPALALVVSIIIFVVGYRLTKDKIAKYQAEIDAKKAKG